MARILVVEDDPAIADLVRFYLCREGHEVEVIGHGVRALHHVEAHHQDLDAIVLDLMLPGLDGRGICRRIREYSDVPIIMLTALDDDRDKIEGLDLGADDYLTKPFNPLELVARVRAVLRRRARSAPVQAPATTAISAGNARIELETRRFIVNGSDVPLRTKEFDLLVALARRPGVVVTREHLLDTVWGGEFEGDTRTVDVHVSRLRDRLDASGANLEIETVRSVGYRLAPRQS
jgi:DNA-binding response OmpR family regulator